MITCRELAELLCDVVSGQLPPGQGERVDRHLGCCPACVAYLESYRLTIRLTRRLAGRPLPPRLVQRLLAALNEDPGGPEDRLGPRAKPT